MATTNTFPKDRVAVGPITIVNADSTNIKVLLDNSAGAKALRIEQLTICSDDTTARNVQFSRLASAVDYLIGTVNVPVASGSDGTTPRVTALSSSTSGIGALDSDGLYVCWVPAGQKLDVKVLIAVTADKTVTISGWARSFEA
jgi:hypothetical protein